MARDRGIDETSDHWRNSVICSAELSINCILFKKFIKYEVIKPLGKKMSSRTY